MDNSGVKAPMPTKKDIDELVAFLPRLCAEGFSPISEWSSCDKDEDGVMHLPEPTYEPVVREFFRAASRDCWVDRGYNVERAERMLASEETIKTADLAQIRTMLTYCGRLERFCDGHWASMIKGGYIRRLLERLVELGGEGDSI